MFPSAVKKVKKKHSRMLTLSSQTVHNSVSGVHGGNQSTRLTANRRSISMGAGSKLVDKTVTQIPKQGFRVFDEDGNDVTPQSLYKSEPGVVQGKTNKFLMDELSVGPASEQTSSMRSFTVSLSRSVLGSSRISNHSTTESPKEDVEDTLTKRDTSINVPVTQNVQMKKDILTVHLTEDILEEIIDIHISETDNISLLDIPNTFVSVEAEDAEHIIRRNHCYDEVCKKSKDSEEYVARSMQTFNGAVKNKLIQTDKAVMVNTATNCIEWDINDRLYGLEQTEMVPGHESEKTDVIPILNGSSDPDGSTSVGSITTTGSGTSSLKQMDTFGEFLNAESELQRSKTFRHSLLIMERCILGNIFHPKLAVYRNLPITEDPDFTVRPGTKMDVETSLTPELEHLWTFSCELSRGHSVSSMAWNKRNLDLLAVGYGGKDSDNKSGLVCCWSLKNPMWPERVFHCASPVSSLDFSANNPSQLAVGMHEGTITVFSVQSQDNAFVISSNECPDKHFGPVWQVRWTQEGVSLNGDDKEEALFSVGADGRVCKWIVCNSGLTCTDLLKLKKMPKSLKKAAETNKENTDSFLSSLSPGLCFDFHPKDTSIYLVGTWEGLIYKCSIQCNTEQYLETFMKHFCCVNQIAWCPLNPDVFLTCSSDWTIQLWNQDHHRPILEFTSNQKAVYSVQWSPKCATVFGAVNGGHVEIWDLNSSVLDPAIVHIADPGVALKTLLFATATECVLIGDSEGQVTVYHLKNLNVGENSQVDILEGIIQSAVSRQL
ncbi:WD repeat-containing protein 78 [Thalassophryne amazonica]|uniref:WD repeat-containing protein 78 n=1 Tax=Thalassophryne amazonica TaxID=390379 RepID=UPI001471A214|nr:WD repeat-containing protein 78 [Thalassophryne amazonica]